MSARDSSPPNRRAIALPDAELLAGIVETTTDLVAVVSAEGELEYVNPAGRRMAGLDRDGGLIGVRESDLYAPGTSEQLAEEARLLAARDGTWTGDVLMRGPGGSAIAASKVVIAHVGTDGKPLRTTSIVRDVTEQRRLEQQLERRAMEDDLTRLANRPVFMRELADAHRRFRRLRQPGALLVLKLDRFDVIADAIGLERADDVLCEVSQRLLLAAGPEALVARLGGATFGLLPRDALSELEAVELARIVAESVSSAPVWVGETVVLAPRVGVAELPPTPVREDELVRAAEVAAHRAIAIGVSVMCHDESMSEAARRALQVEAQLRKAVDEESWWLVYQPIVRIDNLAVVSAEALLRFDPGDQQASPYAHIVLAEELGLVVPLGRAALRVACAEAARWRQAVSVNVNVSRRQLGSSKFVDDVEGALADTSLRASRLTVEVTESAAMADPAAAIEILDSIRGLGTTIALDDFGTGHSSLAALDSLPIDHLKLDASFTRGITDQVRKRSLVGAAIALAHDLGVTVTAEGVESRDELSALADLGCDRVQGYLVARPGRPDELRAVSAFQ